MSDLHTPGFEHDVYSLADEIIFAGVFAEDEGRPDTFVVLNSLGTWIGGEFHFSLGDAEEWQCEKGTLEGQTVMRVCDLSHLLRALADRLDLESYMADGSTSEDMGCGNGSL